MKYEWKVITNVGHSMMKHHLDQCEAEGFEVFGIYKPQDFMIVAKRKTPQYNEIKAMEEIEYDVVLKALKPQTPKSRYNL